MSAKHTLGPLTHEGQGDITGIENDPANGCVGKVDVACVYLRAVPGRHEANARRLVACWNACEGITTNELEEIAATGGMLGPREDVARIAKQRDELLEALESIMEMLDDEIQTSTDEQLAFGLADPACPDHIKSELKCVIACRAAIAKAGGEA